MKTGLLTALGVLLATSLILYTNSAKAQTYLTPSELQYESEPYTEPYAGAYTAYTNTKAKKRIMRTARSYAGTPFDQYSWSCSDYTRAVYGNALGVWLPDWDDKQTHYGYAVSRPRRGDLVWFHEPGYGSSYGKATHVGVYAGGGYLWHSSSYWGTTTKTAMMYIGGYRGARRIR